MIVTPDHKIIFDPILVGTEAVQSFHVKTDANDQKWTVTPMPDFNQSLNAFIVKKKITKGTQQVKHEIIIQYKPLQADQSHVNYYLIKNIYEEDIILYVRGYSKGRSIQASIKHINFYQLKNDVKIKTTFELQNKSKCKIKYQFDIDNSQKKFEIEPKTGEVLPEKYVYISAKFVSVEPGIFFLDLPCLFDFHPPVFVELFAINSLNSTEYNIENLRGQYSKLTLKNGFEKFLTDTCGCLNKETICSISPNCLDFSLKANKNIAFPEFFNKTEQCIKILWNSHKETPVSVSPNNVYVLPLERSIFQLEFAPKNLETFYGGILYGRGIIFAETKNQEDPNTIIFPLFLRYIGNSFKKTHNWTPNCEIYPEILIMPICMKNQHVYNTFYIKKFGDFPVVFKILPPKNTRFHVKPLIGIIADAFQIFVVKFSSGDSKHGKFEETWKIELNQNENIHLEIKFKAFAQQPELIINYTNKIHFGKVFPDCKKYIKTCIMNNTQNKIKYKFETNKWFTVIPDNDNDVIDCYTDQEIEWCFTAKFDVEEVTRIEYVMIILDENEIVSGLSFPGYIEIFAQCVYGRLCSSPTRHDFQTLQCGVPTSTTFTVYNFSEVTLHFLLKMHKHYGISEENPVTLTPSKGSLKPGDHMDINVSVLTFWSYLSTYCVQYSLLESKNSDKIVKDQGKTFSTTGILFRLEYYSFYPTIKFIEVGHNTTGPLFGKLPVWEYFKIDSLNKLLRSIRVNETKEYRIRVPDAETGLNIVKTISFIVKNITMEDTIFRIERKKVCDCDLKEVKNAPGIATFRKYTYEKCPHRKILFVSTSEDIVKAYTTIFFKVDIHYILSGSNEVCYLLHLSHNRTIELRFEIIGLKPSELSTYSAGFTLFMMNAFVGELNPDLQIFWFLNNTRDGSTYKVDIGPLETYNKIWGYNVLTCLNPNGIVDAKSICSIQFLFSPIADGIIELNLPFDFGSEKKTLKILGCARNYYTSPLEELYFTELGKDVTKLPDLSVNISTEHVVIRAIPSHCTTTRILSLKNISTTRVIGFIFDNYILNGILTAWVSPKSGMIQPRERLALILHVASGGIACALRITVPCYLVDYTTLKKHIDSTAEFHRQTEKRSEHFFVKEDGSVIYPDMPDMEITPPPVIFHRNVAVTCHIIPHVDLDMKMPIQDQLKQTPFTTFSMYCPDKLGMFLIPRPKSVEEPIILRRRKLMREPKKKAPPCYGSCCLTFQDKEYVATHTVLSCLLDDIVFSKKFKHYIGNLQNTCLMHYAQYKTERLTVEEEMKEAKLILNEVPKKLLAQTMQVLLGDSILKYFNMGLFPFENEKVEVKKNLTCFGKLMYAEKFSFLLDNI